MELEKNCGKNVKVCKHGLNDIWINNADGSVRMCGWSNYFIGDLSKQTIEEIWHGEAAQKFRESLLDGSYRYCNHAKCPYCANQKLEEQFVDYEVPEYPTMCSLSYQLQCNYVCKFCREKHYVCEGDERQKYIKIETEVKKMIPSLKEIASNGAGELFCSDSILDVLAEAELAPDAKVSLETNGSLFNEKNWSKISHLGDHHLTVYVTVHSFQEDTYQYLSGTQLSVQNVINNLYFLSHLREKGIINHLEIATVICEYNFRELPEFVRKCLEEFCVDKIRLRFFEPYGVMANDVEWFYDIRNPYHPYYNEFVKIMQKPIFQNEKIWKWQGEGLSLQNESPYVLEHRNYVSLAELVLLKCPCKTVEKYLKHNNISSIALYCAASGGRAYIKLLQEYGMDVRVIFDKNECESVENTFEIMHPDESNISNFDMILVTQNVYYSQVAEELERLKYKGQVKSMECFVNELKSLICN